MKSPIPSHAERIVLGELAAFIWRTDLGWTILQWPYQFDLENITRNGQPGHTIDAMVLSGGPDMFEGYLMRNEAGHMDRETFIPIVETGLRLLRKTHAPPERIKIKE